MRGSLLYRDLLENVVDFLTMVDILVLRTDFQLFWERAGSLNVNQQWEQPLNIQTGANVNSLFIRAP